MCLRAWSWQTCPGPSVKKTKTTQREEELKRAAARTIPGAALGTYGTRNPNRAEPPLSHARARGRGEHVWITSLNLRN